MITTPAMARISLRRCYCHGWLFIQAPHEHHPNLVTGLAWVMVGWAHNAANEIPQRITAALTSIAEAAGETAVIIRMLVAER